MRGMLAEAQAQALALAAPTPLLQGRHLLEMGLEAGPEIGRILRAAYESQLDGVFQTLDAARAWARQRIAPPSGDSSDP